MSTTTTSPPQGYGKPAQAAPPAPMTLHESHSLAESLARLIAKRLRRNWRVIPAQTPRSSQPSSWLWFHRTPAGWIQEPEFQLVIEHLLPGYLKDELTAAPTSFRKGRQ